MNTLLHHPLMRKQLLYGFSCFILWSIMLALSSWVYPRFDVAEIQWGKEAPTTIQWPFIKGYEVPDGPFTISLNLRLQRLHPRLFAVVADDQLLSVEVNDNQALPSQFPIAYHPFSPQRLDLGNVLKPGENRLVFRMENRGGRAGLRISVHALDPLHVAWALLLIASAGAMLIPFARRMPCTFGGCTGWIVFSGIALRILYFCATPYYVRGHDQGGHIEYLKYVAMHLALPDSRLGWETHQPPLYYLMGGLWLRLTGQNPNSSWIYGQWQAFALLLSIGTMILAALIAKWIFPREDGTKQRNLSLAIVACFPGLIFYSARINNDVLSGFVCFLWLWLFLRWWENPAWRTWLPVCFTIALGMLTKNTVLVLGAVSIVCLLLKKAQKPIVLAKNALAFAAIVLLVAGWYQIPRMIIASDSSSFIVGNLDPASEGLHLPETLRVPGTPGSLVTFNPVEVVRVPFNDPWNDEYRRGYFLEFLFKSSLFGEWPWDDHLLVPARLLAVLGMFVGLLSMIGGACSSKNIMWRMFPLVISLGAMISAQMLFVMKAPYACHQDFRFFVLLIVPVATLAAMGARAVGRIGEVAILLFAIECLAFLTPLLYV